MSNKAVIQTDQAPAAIGTYSQAIKTGDTVYLSGQIPLDPKTMDMVSDDFAAQAQQVFTNLAAVCEASGGTLQDMVKLNIYLADLGKFAQVNEIMASFFSTPYPARAAVEVAGLPRAAQIEIDGIMVVSS